MVTRPGKRQPRVNLKRMGPDEISSLTKRPRTQVTSGEVSKSLSLDTDCEGRVQLKRAESEVETVLQKIWSEDSTKDMCIFTAGGEVLGCHRAVFALASNFVKDTLLDTRDEESCLILPDFDAQTVQDFLLHLYTANPSTDVLGPNESTTMEALLDVLKIGLKPMASSNSEDISTPAFEKEDQLQVSNFESNEVEAETVPDVESISSFDQQLDLVTGLDDVDEMVTFFTKYHELER